MSLTASTANKTCLAASPPVRKLTPSWLSVPGTLGAGSGGTNAGAISFNLNGTAIQATSSNMRTDLDGLVTAINDVSGATGVTAQKVDLPGSFGFYRSAVRC